MSNTSPRISLPAEAIAEFESVERSDWTDGIGLEELVDWINWVADRFRPDEIDESARTSQEFTQRSFRHYQTLGCIDKPERVGRKGVYRFRQYLQALLIRKLLWERVPSSQIVPLMKGRSNEELKRLLFEGIEIVPNRTRDKEPCVSRPSGHPDSWTRVPLGSGIELHFREGTSKPGPAEIGEIIENVRRYLESR